MICVDSISYCVVFQHLSWKLVTLRTIKNSCSFCNKCYTAQYLLVFVTKAGYIENCQKNKLKKMPVSVTNVLLQSTFWCLSWKLVTLRTENNCSFSNKCFTAQYLLVFVMKGSVDGNFENCHSFYNKYFAAQ